MSYKTNTEWQEDVLITYTDVKVQCPRLVPLEPGTRSLKEIERERRKIRETSEDETKA